MSLKSCSVVSPSYLVDTEDDCFALYEDSPHDAIWTHYYGELNPRSRAVVNCHPIKTLVLDDLARHQSYIAQTIDLINTDRLSDIVCPGVALDVLKRSKYSLDCTLHVLSCLRKSCTELFTKIVEEAKENHVDYKEPIDLLHHLLCGGHGRYEAGDAMLCITEMHYKQYCKELLEERLGD